MTRFPSKRNTQIIEKGTGKERKKGIEDRYMQKEERTLIRENQEGLEVIKENILMKQKDTDIAGTEI